MLNHIAPEDIIVPGRRRQAIFPATEIVNGRPTVNGISYLCYSDAIKAKRAAVTYIYVDICGQEVA